MKGFSVLNHLFRSKYNFLFIRLHYSDGILSLHCFFVCSFFCFLRLKRARVQFWHFFFHDIGGKGFILKEKIFLLVQVNFLFAFFKIVKLIQVLAKSVLLHFAIYFNMNSEKIFLLKVECLLKEFICQ